MNTKYRLAYDKNAHPIAAPPIAEYDYDYIFLLTKIFGCSDKTGTFVREIKSQGKNVDGESSGPLQKKKRKYY